VQQSGTEVALTTSTAHKTAFRTSLLSNLILGVPQLILLNLHQLEWIPDLTIGPLQNEPYNETAPTAITCLSSNARWANLSM